MVLHFCIIPNCGARIGHQSHEHFVCVTYCRKNNFKFIYHPFIGNSKTMETTLSFGYLYDLYYKEIKDKMKTIKISDLPQNPLDAHNNLVELNNLDEDIMLFDGVQGNEKFFYKMCCVSNNENVETKKLYRNLLDKNGSNKKIVNSGYICIHIRCGDIVNYPSRYLNTDYFIEKYHELINLLENKELPVYVVAENNFSGDEILKEKIKNCNIIKTDEITSFYYLVNCDYLIASRSGFSNLAYILGDMKVLKPPNDWNCYYDNLLN